MGSPVGRAVARPPRVGATSIFRVSSADRVSHEAGRSRLVLGFDGVLPYDLDGLVAERVQILEGL